MDKLFDALTQFFRDGQWTFAQAWGQPVLQLRFLGKHGRWDCYAHARADEQQIAFYPVCAINAPEERRAALAEFLTRANYGLMPGNFEMDWDTGEIRFKSVLEVDGARPAPA